MSGACVIVRGAVVAVAALALFALHACGDGYNPAKVRMAANNEFPGSELQPLPGQQYQYVVRKPDGSIWLAQYMGSDTKSTAVVQLFGPAR